MILIENLRVTEKRVVCMLINDNLLNNYTEISQPKEFKQRPENMYHSFIGMITYLICIGLRSLFGPLDKVEVD